jgi:hypothetical protein
MILWSPSSAWVAAVARKGAIEALPVAQAGTVLSCEIIGTGVPTPFSKAEGHIHEGAIASVR